MDVKNSTVVTTSSVAAAAPRAENVTAQEQKPVKGPDTETKVTLSEEGVRMAQLASDPGDWPTPPTENKKNP